MPKKGYRPTEEHRMKLSRSARGKRKTQEVREKIALKLRGRNFETVTKCLMRRREEEKRKLYKLLINHLTVAHPNFKREECKGWYVWRSCPVCDIDVKEWKVQEVNLRKEIKVASPVQEPKSPKIEENLIEKTIAEEMKLGGKK